MKSVISGYNHPSEEQFKKFWSTGIFVLDTNVLLNLYRYSRKASTQLLAIIEQLSDRTWIPHQVALEFYRNRPEVLSTQIATYDGLIKEIDDSRKKLFDAFEQKIRNRHPYIEIDHLKNIIEPSFQKANEYLKKQKGENPDLDSSDEILNRIESLFTDKVGDAYPPSKLMEIYRIGKERYDLEIPPGLKDKAKPGADRYGDLILWFQIIDEAKKRKTPIIFVSDDEKDDWRAGSRGKKTGPRPELIQEIWLEAEVEFYVYSSDKFMDYSGRYLNRAVEPEIIEDIKAVNNFTRERLEIWASDTASLRQLISETPAGEKLEKEVKQTLLKLIDSAASIEVLTQATRQWATDLNLTQGQVERLVRSVNFKELSRLINNRLEQMVQPETIFEDIDIGNPDVIIDIPKLQSLMNETLQEIIAEPRSQEWLEQALEENLRNSHRLPEIKDKVSLALNKRLRAEGVTDVLEMFLIKAYKKVQKQTTPSRRTSGK